MTSKKYKLILGAALLMLSATSAIAQTGAGFTPYSNDVIPEKRMPQQNNFNNGTYMYPAKPRNQIEVGVSLGALQVSGDVPAKFLTAPNFAIHVRKALGYIFSLRLQYVNGKGEGMHWLGAQNYAKNSAWQSTGYNAAYRIPSATGDRTRTSNGGPLNIIFYNYQAKIQDIALQGLVNFNNIRFHKKKTNFNLYGGGGIGATIYKTNVNASKGGASYAGMFQTTYNKYATTGYYSHADRKKVLSDLKAGMDKTYETPADGHRQRRPGSASGSKNTLKPSGMVILGAAYRLTKNINIALEDRHTFVKDDLLDGQRWQEHAWGDAAMTRDFDSWNYVSLGLNFNLGSKATEPLYWMNPLDYAYNEVKNPKNIKVDMNCADGDGDGVCDFLDKELNTPAGCPVDTHGVTKDTDGDGVPDCKDKQLITPTECQPVDADGIGKCPPPACCSEVKPVDPVTSASCTDCNYPSVGFKSGSPTPSSDARTMLDQVAAKLTANDKCMIAITGHSATSKSSQDLCNKRSAAILKYLTEVKGISADRISISCDQTGEASNTFDINCQ